MNEGGSFRVTNSEASQDSLYEIIQYKAEDEFFLETGIEMAAIEKFRSVNKRIKDPTRATSTNDCESLVSSYADDDAIPGMKEMGKKVENRLSNEAP